MSLRKEMLFNGGYTEDDFVVVSEAMLNEREDIGSRQKLFLYAVLEYARRLGLKIWLNMKIRHIYLTQDEEKFSEGLFLKDGAAMVTLIRTLGFFCD